MHRSRLSTFCIDCKSEDVDAAAAFWSKALGREVVPPPEDAGAYRELTTRSDEPILLIQKVDHPGDGRGVLLSVRFDAF